MTRAFLQPGDLHDFVAQQFGAGRRLTALDRLTGGTKKGVYRLTLDDATTAVLYVWAAGENYWPPSPTVLDDPFTDASGVELFAANHAALSAVGVRTPRLFMLDRDGRYLGADIALVEDAGSLRLEALMERDPVAAAAHRWRRGIPDPTYRGHRCGPSAWPPRRSSGPRRPVGQSAPPDRRARP
jgi:hypothetical protein